MPCRLRFCSSASCRSRGSDPLRRQCAQIIPVQEVGCLGPWSEGPLLVVETSTRERLLEDTADNTRPLNIRCFPQRQWIDP